MPQSLYHPELESLIVNGSADVDSLSLTGERENDFASNQDDLSDVTVHFQKKNTSSTTEYTLVDTSNGPKTVLNVFFAGGVIQDTAGNTGRIGPVTIDGTSNSPFPSSNSHQHADASNNNINKSAGTFAFIYDSSLKIEWEHSGSGGDCYVTTYVLGSGPHTAAVVQDRAPVYSVHRNLSNSDIDALTPPSGYKIVKNPDLSHPDPMVRGAWDDANGEVVDHPYWKDFHDALDKIRALGEQYGPQKIVTKAGGTDTADPPTVNVSLPDPANGNANPDPSDTSNIEADAMAFAKDQWDGQLPGSI